MITRGYCCDNCDYYFEVQQELHDEKRLKRCPQCKKHKLYQDLTGQHTFVRQEPKTLLHQAARNTEEMGKYELQSKRHEEKKRQDKPKLDVLKQQGVAKANAETLDDVPAPWYNSEKQDLTKKLGKLSKKQKKKYILEGKIE